MQWQVKNTKFMIMLFFSLTSAPAKEGCAILNLHIIISMATFWALNYGSGSFNKKKIFKVTALKDAREKCTPTGAMFYEAAKISVCYPRTYYLLVCVFISPPRKLERQVKIIKRQIRKRNCLRALSSLKCFVITRFNYDYDYYYLTTSENTVVG